MIQAKSNPYSLLGLPSLAGAISDLYMVLLLKVKLYLSCYAIRLYPLTFPS